MRGLLMRYGLTLAQPGVLDLVLPRGMSLAAWTASRAAFRREWTALMDRIIDQRERLRRRRARPATCSTCSPPRATRRRAPGFTREPSCATRSRP